MINKYQSNGKVLKEYKAKNVKTGTAKNGSTYTMCQISDCKKVDDDFVYNNYALFSWQEDLRLEDGDKIVIDEITALEVEETEYNGKSSVKKTIFADIHVTVPANPNKVEVVGELPSFDDNASETLPF